MTDRLGPAVYVRSAGPHHAGTLRGALLADGYITSTFGSWSNTRKSLGIGPHRGVDLAVATGVGTPLAAMAPGTVRLKAFDSIDGHYVSITTSGGGAYQYLHMQEPSPLEAGDFVRRGDVVGKMGETGRAVGAHVHVNYTRRHGGSLPWEDSVPFFTTRAVWRGVVAASGQSLVSWGGGTVAELIEELEANRVTTAAVYVHGSPVMCVAGAQAFVNQDFHALFPGDIPEGTILQLTVDA